MTESGHPDDQGGPARRWLVIGSSVVLVVIAAALALTVVDPGEPRRSVVVYEVSGDAAMATVTYSTFNEHGEATGREELSRLPWRKELAVPGEVQGGVLTVTIGAAGGSVGCSVTVDGAVRRSATATGPLTSALCGGF